MNTTFWEKIQQGDEEAFRQLYSKHSKKGSIIKSLPSLQIKK